MKNTKKEFTLNDNYEHYLLTNRFAAVVLFSSYKKNEFEEVKQKLEKQLTSFEFIYGKLNDIEKLEFKCDYLDTLENMKSHQKLSKFKALIDIQLSKVNGFCGEPQKKKPGRPSVKVKHAKEYLQNFELPENKIKFLKALKIEYSNVNHKTFNHLMIALNEMEYLKPATKTEYRKAFEKALDRKSQTKQNFDKQFKDKTDPIIYDGIKSRISNIIQSQTLV